MNPAANPRKSDPPQVPQATNQSTCPVKFGLKAGFLWRMGISAKSNAFNRVADVADERGIFREVGAPPLGAPPRRTGTRARKPGDRILREMTHEERSASIGMVAHLGVIPGRGPSVFPLVPAICQGSAPTPRKDKGREP